MASKPRTTLTGRLKLLLGRQLSPQDMKGAPPYELASRTCVPSEDSPKKVRTFGILPSGEFFEERERLKFMTTPDSSEGWRRPHKGYYPYMRVESTYDARGRLTQRRTTHICQDFSGNTRLSVFHPPGRFFGRVTESYGWPSGF